MLPKAQYVPHLDDLLFPSFCAHPGPSKLREGDGLVTLSQPDILRIGKSFCTSLYDTKATQLFLSSIAEVLDHSTGWGERLGQPLSLNELAKVLESLERVKLPESDGLLAKLYSALWDLIGQDLLEVYDSILPADYKILSKVIAKWVRSALGSVTHPNQTCAVPGNTISDSLTLLRDMITYVQENGVWTPAFISLDQEMAFDTILLKYMWDILLQNGLRGGN
eukprot:g33591.t1